LIAAEAKYHPTCLLSLYRKAVRVHADVDESNLVDDSVVINVNSESLALALAELIAYIEDIKTIEFTPTVFKLSELSKIYSGHLKNLGVTMESKIHSSRLNECLLDNKPNLTAVAHGKDVYLTFAKHMGVALQQMHASSDTEAIHLTHTAKMILKEIFTSTFAFNGSLASSSQKNAVAPTLQHFVH